MQLIIESENTLSDIRTYFHKEFPNLKLEFFKDRNTDGKLSADEMVKQEALSLEEFSGKKTNEKLHLAPEMLVAEVEMMFLDIFNVYVQVFRKSGNAWLVTSNTDYHSLHDLDHYEDEQQNAAGDESYFEDEE